MRECPLLWPRVVICPTFWNAIRIPANERTTSRESELSLQEQRVELPRYAMAHLHMMSKTIFGTLAAIAELLLLTALPSTAVAEETAHNQAAACTALKRANFSDIADAPTWIISTGLVIATGADPAYCKVFGTIEPRIGIEMRLPVKNWNGKFLEYGCGGWCGVIFSDGCMSSLRRGYACIASDMGHKGSQPFDLRWWKDNLQGQIDFGFRATHVAALAGKAIAAQYYGAPPIKSYYYGCSTGGYQGVMEAQRFPWDFDGIIAGAPDIDSTQSNFRGLWWTRSNHDANGNQILGEKELTLLHNTALALCDLDDGVKDGIIGNPLGCKFKPRTLLCKQGETSRCLSSAQVDAAEKFYSGPVNSAGELTSTGSFLVGSELAWEKAGWGSIYFRDGLAGYSTGADFKDADFDFDRDYKRLGLAPWYDNSNPDLRRLKAAGGKLIVYHGTNDTDDPPGPVIDYYETVEKTMGGQKNTEAFFRLFLIPGMNHCGGGIGAMNVDWLRILEKWVEEGTAPDSVVGTHASEGNEPNFTRPLFLYPDYAKYKGTGNVNKAENFRRVSGEPSRSDQ